MKPFDFLSASLLFPPFLMMIIVRLDPPMMTVIFHYVWNEKQTPPTPRTIPPFDFPPVIAWVRRHSVCSSLPSYSTWLLCQHPFLVSKRTIDPRLEINTFISFSSKMDFKMIQLMTPNGHLWLTGDFKWTLMSDGLWRWWDQLSSM